MRILMVNKYARVTGGADKQCMSLAASLRDLDHDVAFLAMASPGNTEREGLFVPTHVTHETRETLSLSERAWVARRALWNRDAAAAMDRLIADFRPDLVHVHRLYPQLSVSPVRVARRHRLPVVQTLHDYEFLSADPFDATGRLLDRRQPHWSYRLLNTATFVVRRTLHAPLVTEWIAVSDFVARAHVVRGIHATVIPNFAASVPARERPPFEARAGILFLGALSDEKGVLDVLELARGDADLNVVIAGRGPLREKVAADAARLPNVRFRGLLDSAAVAEEVGAARVVVVPSHWEEPGSLVALEAMASGTPIVAYRRGGLGEYVTASGGGLAIDPDPRLLRSTCKKLLADNDLWHQCSAAGLHASRTMFSSSAHTAAVVGVYERAVAQAGRTAS